MFPPFFLKDLCKVGTNFFFTYLIKLSSGTIWAWRILFQELFKYEFKVLDYKTI